MVGRTGDAFPVSPAVATPLPVHHAVPRLERRMRTASCARARVCVGCICCRHRRPNDLRNVTYSLQQFYAVCRLRHENRHAARVGKSL